MCVLCLCLLLARQTESVAFYSVESKCENYRHDHLELGYFPMQMSTGNNNNNINDNENNEVMWGCLLSFILCVCVCLYFVFHSLSPCSFTSCTIYWKTRKVVTLAVTLLIQSALIRTKDAKYEHRIVAFLVSNSFDWFVSMRKKVRRKENQTWLTIFANQLAAIHMMCVKWGK